MIGDDGKVQVLEIPAQSLPEAPPMPAEPESQTQAEPVAEKAPEPEISPPVKTAKVAPAPRAEPEPLSNLPLPARKPVLEMARAPEQASEQAVEPAAGPDSGPLSREQATAIALEIAPPARSMFVRSRNIGGRPAYAVIFRTESGPYEILVDGLSGEVLATQ